MVDVKRKHCEYPGCKKIPNYNMEGETTGRFCVSHKAEGMINVKSNQCEHPGCHKQPHYNIEGETTGRFCVSHKADGMVNVISKRCEYPGCQKHPVYNVEGDTRGRFCASHKADGMVNVISKQCDHPGCHKQPHYNIEGEASSRFCASHKSEGMVDVKSKRCEHPGCQTIPNYNAEGETRGRFCASHKAEGMVDVKSKRCITSVHCGGNFVYNNTYRGHCWFCFVHLYPDEPTIRNYKNKERAVTEYVLEQFSEYTWVVDKRIQDGCSLKKPDITLDLGDQVIMVEIDENQHRGYDCSCDNKRTMELSQDVGHRPIVFIRFNPDNYQSHDGIWKSSCWKKNSLGILQVSSEQTKEWMYRLTTLRESIQYWIDNRTDKTIEFVHLFYTMTN
jgi:hypothetical protein